MFGVGNHHVENIGGFGGEKALKSRPDFFRFGDAFGGHAEALADGEIIRKYFLGVFRVAQESVAAVAGEETIFPLDDHSEVLVINDDRLGRDVFGNGSCQLLDVHKKRTVAVDIDDFAVGAGNLGADGSGIAVSHGAKTGGGQETAGIMKVIELAGPHLVLADPSGDDGLPLGELAEFLDDLLWHDSAGDVGVGKRIFFPPNLDFLAPFLETFRQVRVGTLGEKLIQVLQRKPDIGEHGKMDHFVFVQL